mmetsp:Transcript_14630/g.25905  ORF Transcript_14630/g.25905 Transcript_14630/m.25905 type:complete len:460 (+) Transcript_14630:77-1456(+)
MAPQVSVSLTTLAGASLELELAPEASVRQAKEAASEEFGRPAELQRWLVDGAALEDGELLRDVLQSDATVFCVFLPRTFEIQVTVITWARGTEAEYARDVRVAVSPTLNIEAVKYEIAEKCGLPPGSSMRAARLLKGGLHMDDEKTVEQYHLDPNAKLHFVVPTCWKDQMPDGNAVRACEAARRQPEADQIVNVLSFDEFYGFSKNGDWNFTEKEVSPDKMEVKDGQQSPKGKDPQELLRTMGRYPLRPRRRAASTPPERGTRSDQEATAFSKPTSPVATPELPCYEPSPEGKAAAAVANGSLSLKEIAEAEADNASFSQERFLLNLQGLSRPRIESAKPANASNVSASPCGPSRRPPRPPTRPTTQNGQTQRPPTQRSCMERPETQRGDAEVRVQRPSSNVFNSTSSCEWGQVSSPRQTQRHVMHFGAPGRSLPAESKRVRSASVSAQIDRWAQIQRC